MRLARSYAMTIAAIAAVTGTQDTFAQREISGQIEEVVVTAQHREQNLQDVPIAVTALDESAIEKIFARDLTDVTGKTPNLVLTPILGNGTLRYQSAGCSSMMLRKVLTPRWRYIRTEFIFRRPLVRF